MTLRQWTDDTVAEVLGREHRTDPVLPGGGGPAGNARLTAWTGLVLLVLFVIELATLLDLGPLTDWHVVVGVLLIPPALLKTGTTGWRIIRYYTGHGAYRTAGPPPMLLRVLGPLVVLTTLAVLGTGLALVAVGPEAGRAPWFTVGGRLAVTALVLHKATFVLWAVATGAHTLARLVSAVRLVSGRAIPGRVGRVVVLVLTGLVAIAAAVVVLRLSGAWINLPVHHRHG